MKATSGNKRRTAMRTGAAAAAVAIGGGWLTGRTATAMVNGYQPAPGDTRFDAVGSFGFTVWLNGASQQDNWWGGATLIAPDLIVTARHNLPTNPAQWTDGTYAVRFRRQFDGSVQHKYANGVYPFLAPVREWIAPPTGDIALGILQTPVTHIQPIAADLSVPGLGQAILLAGWGSESLTQGEGNPRNGLRLADKTVTGVGPSFIGFSSAFPTGSPATGSGPNLHDSGGAILSYDASGALRYRGLITTYGGGTGLGQYAGTSFGARLVPQAVIPEPSSFGLLAVAGACFVPPTLLRRRAQQRAASLK